MYKILFVEKNQIWKNFEDLENENLFIDKIAFENLDENISNYHLCIIEVEVQDKEYLNKIKNVIKNNPQIIFWATNSSCNKEDILMAYDLGFKNFVKLPLEKEVLISNIKSQELQQKDKYSHLELNFSDFKDSKILILDDIQMNIELLKEVLKPFQIEPIGYTDPKEALSIINEKRFDLILLDIMMPYITGFEFAEKLKATQKNSTTPVIFISALDNKENKLQGYNLGSYAYIEKPIDIKTTRVQIYNTLKIKKLQDSLFDEKEKLDNIFKFSNSEIILTDQNYNVISQNNRYTVASTDKYYNFVDIIKPLNSETTIKYIEDFGSLPQQNITLRVEYNNEISGTSIPTNVCISKIFTETNTLNGYLIIINDISQEVQNQSQKETFIATLTHDLKTPIRAQIRALELILNNKFGKIDENLSSILCEVLNSCKFMQYMTDNLLTKYKTQNGQLNIVKENKSIYEIIKNNSEKLRYLLEQKNQKIHIVNEAQTGELELDPHAIERVLNNLIINASEYTPDNGIITIKIEEIHDHLKVSVIDNGWGIPKDDIDTIFDEYITSAKRFRKVGYGLGLYICKKIIEGHNGEIYVNSEEGRGSEFIFTLPLRKSVANINK